MTDENNKLYLYEALELRSEYKSRIETLKQFLPENNLYNKNVYSRDDSNNKEPVDTLDIEDIEKSIDSFQKKRRKLNNAIQACNFNNEIKINNEKMSIAEALELRKSVNKKIGELSDKLKKSAYKKVIYKEDRNIEKKPNNDFHEVYKELEDNRLLFRELNRKIRKAGYKLKVDFEDEFGVE